MDPQDPQVQMMMQALQARQGQAPEMGPPPIGQVDPTMLAGSLGNQQGMMGMGQNANLMGQQAMQGMDPNAMQALMTGVPPNAGLDQLGQ